MRRALLAFALALAAAGCGSPEKDDGKTQLSRKAAFLRMNSGRDYVLQLLGTPSRVVMRGDFGEWTQALENPKIAFVLYWKNGPNCSPVVVTFNAKSDMNGIDAGVFCGDGLADNLPPAGLFSCERQDRAELCR